MTSISDEWNIFINALFGGQRISKLQYQEMRKAFYAGFGSAMTKCTLEIIDLTQEDATNVLRNLSKEFAAFVKEHRNFD